MDNDDIYQTLLEIKESSGRQEQMLKSHIDSYNAHLLECDRRDTRISVLETAAARQSGFVTALAAFGTLIGVVLGYVVTLIAGKH